MAITLPELVAPITVDLRKTVENFDVIKGIEHMNYMDVVLANEALNIVPGQWMTLSSTGLVVPATGNAVANVYPVVVGNNEYDSIATGDLTIAVSGGFIYRTVQFVAASYTVGQNLCVKNLGGGEMVPSAAGGSDAIVARVFAINTVTGTMDIQVLDR